MTIDRFSAPTSGASKQCPADMPRGDSEADKAARVRFWIERGNQLLEQMGKRDLRWVHVNGHYSIERY